MRRLILGFLLSVFALPVCEAQQKSGYTIEYTTKTYYKTGKVRSVRHSVLAVRGDGSWAMVYLKRRGDPASVVRKEIWDAGSLDYAFVEAGSRMVTMMAPPGVPRVPGQLNQVLCARARALDEPMLGYSVRYHEPPTYRMTAFGEQPVSHGVWIAPGLNCVALRTESEMSGAVDTLEVKTATRIVPGEPEAWLFEIPADFKVQVAGPPRRAH